ncbi:MAG: cupin domain-containing protein [Clostridia bacterium]|nr:cupin domain-containing protein [Clostridia bacterium]
MLRLRKDQRTEYRENSFGGRGTVEIRHLIEPADHTNSHLRLLAKITLQPGVTVGEHSHEGITESIYILEGRAIYNDGAERLLEPGDAAVVSESDRQSIRCAEDTPLTYLAVIVLP